MEYSNEILFIDFKDRAKNVELKVDYIPQSSVCFVACP